jgi:predicted Zn-dependent protease
VLLLAACAATLVALAAHPADGGLTLRPPNTQPASDSVEGGLWGHAQRAEQALLGSADINDDGPLGNFVTQVACRVAPDYCGELRVYVVDRPFFNATAYANGALEVWSGLLLRARTEDELAFVIGHEVAHYARNHSLARQERENTTRNVLLAVNVALTAGTVAAVGSVAGAPNGAQAIDSISQAAQALSNLAYLAGMAHVFSYSREQEEEADHLGHLRMVRAGYAPAASAEIWRQLVAEHRSSDIEDVRESDVHGTIFDTHPITVDRIRNLGVLANGAPMPTELAGQRAYRERIRPFIDRWLVDELRRRDFGETLHLLDRMEALGEDLGLLAFYRGEALRRRGGPGDSDAAVAAYRLAAAHEDAPDATWRALGDVLSKAGDIDSAIEAYEGYLARAPDANDRWLVEATLKSLKSRKEARS